MMTRDYKDIAAGALLFAGGVVFAWYTYSRYDIGTLRQMGPGMLPLALGLILAIFGVALFVPALFRPGVMPEIRIRSPLFVLLGTASFALLMRPFGLIPAIVAVTVISSFADLKVRPLGLAVLSAILCLLVWLIFRVGLGLPIVMLRWPF